MTIFKQKLQQASATNKSLVCIGLDPDLDKMPTKDVYEFNQKIIEATADLVCAYKPNLAYYESLGLPGLIALEKTISYIKNKASSVLIIGDGKRGDIGSSSEAYAKAMFQVWGFDAATINSWGGRDTVEPFVANENYGAFLWCRGSNPGSSDLQDLIVKADNDEKPLYEHLAQESLNWGKGNLGLVVGATVPDQLRKIRQICPETPILVPGIGAQGGDLTSAILNGVDSHGRSVIISSSRAIIYASRCSDFPDAAREAALLLRGSINQILDGEGKGWQ